MFASLNISGPWKQNLPCKIVIVVSDWTCLQTRLHLSAIFNTTQTNKEVTMQYWVKENLVHFGSLVFDFLITFYVSITIYKQKDVFHHLAIISWPMHCDLSFSGYPVTWSWQHSYWLSIWNLNGELEGNGACIICFQPLECIWESICFQGSYGATFELGHFPTNFYLTTTVLAGLSEGLITCTPGASI